MNKIICSLRYLKHLLWNNGGIIILHNVYEMDLFSREKFKAKLYQILIKDVLNKFQWPIVPLSPKRKWDASGDASGSSGFNRPELSCKCTTNIQPFLPFRAMFSVRSWSHKDDRTQLFPLLGFSTKILTLFLFFHLEGSGSPSLIIPSYLIMSVTPTDNLTFTEESLGHHSTHPSWPPE